MKKFIILIFLLSFTFILHANPIMPKILSEIYFDDNDEWSIELYDYSGLTLGNLDSSYLISSSDTAYFNDGISFNYDDTLVVTNSDMQTDFTIDKDGDILYIDGSFYDEMYWGNYPYSHVNAPSSGQSLCRVAIGNDDPYFLLAKEGQPSLGYNPFHVQTFGNLEGYVYDETGSPIEGTEVVCSCIFPLIYMTTTNCNGFFGIYNMYAMNYDLSTTLCGYTPYDTTVTIEPNATTFIIIQPNCAIEQIQIYQNISISNHPNPFYEETEIHYSLPHNSTGTITIFNSKGLKVKEIPVSPNENSISWSGFNEHNKKVPSGVYYYKLESRDKTLASGKMLYLR